MNGLETEMLERAELFREAKSSEAEGLRKRVAMLDREDRMLAELAMNGGTTHRRIGELLGVGPGTISRRLRRIGSRLHDPIVERLLDPRCPLGPDYRQIGVEHFLVGRAFAEIAEAHQRTYASVRQTIDYVRAWHESTRSVVRDIRASR